MASRLESEWEVTLAELQQATKELEQLRIRQPVTLSDAEREELRSTCEGIASLWSNGATIPERKQIVRLLLRRIEMEVHNNTERVSVRLHWSGGFESSHVITRTITHFCQLEAYDQLIDRILELTLAGKCSPEVASILEREGFRSPRSNTPISSMMVQKLMRDQPRCREKLTNPSLPPNHWRSDDLAKELGMSEKQLKSWGTRGWVTATGRPFGRVWVIYADAQEVARLQRLHCSQTGQGRPKPPVELRTPALLPRKSAEN